jgi:hypothetical protein
MSTNQWFLIKSLGVTVDLSLVTQVIWNYKVGGYIYTKIGLGTSIAYDPGLCQITGNAWWISEPDDRKKLQAHLIALGLPTVELIFCKDNPSKPQQGQGMTEPAESAYD